MRTCIIIILTLTFSVNNLYGQNNLNESITKFESDCSDAVSIEEQPNEFTLLKLESKPETSTLNFEIVANCAQKNNGSITIVGDTLKIDNTDMSTPETKRYEILDSAGNVVEIVEETFVADIAFCDCLVNFYYELSISLANIKFLTFHERTFELARTK